MSIESELVLRLAETEDALVERKPTADKQLVRENVCAFANSVRQPNTGVLFLGVDNSGKPNGKIGDPEKTQIDVRSWITACYPLIAGVQTYALTIKGQQVVAVVVPESRNRPHFTGPAFVRNGPETQIANESQFEKLIEDRSDLVWYLRTWVGRGVTVCWEGASSLGRWGSGTPGWTLADLNQFFLTLSRTTAGREGKRESVSLRRVCLEHDTVRNQPLLKIEIG